jgi:hypothetical protein
MRLTLENAPRVASVPMGVGVGLWTASLMSDTSNLPCGHIIMCTLGPRFALWQCALFGAGALSVVLFLSWAGSRADALRALSLPVGIGVGLWTAQQIALQNGFFWEPSFAVWQCALFGAGAAVVLILLSRRVARVPSAGPPKAA